MDSEFHRKLPPESPNYKWDTIGNYLTQSQYGLSIEMNEDGVGTPIYRMNEIHNMLCDSDISKCAEIEPSDIKKYQLHDRDILFNRTNSQAFVGRTGLFLSSKSSVKVFASYLVRFRTDEQYVLPEFLTAYLNSSRGVREVKRRSRISINQSNVNPEEVKAIRMPLLPLSFQLKLKQLFKAAHTEQQKSEILQTQAEKTLLSSIGLENWQPPNLLTYEATANKVFASGRLDSKFFLPACDSLYDHLKNNGNISNLSSLITNISRGRQPNYADEGLPVINSKHVNHGLVKLDEDNRTATRSEISILVEKGDVLINGTGVGTLGRAAPYLNSREALPDNHVTVLKIDPAIINPIYLSVFLNSIAGQLQTDKWYKGSSGQIELYPDDIKKFFVWVAPKKVQEKIADYIQRSLDTKQESAHLLERAKRAVEIAIEQDEKTAMAYLDGKHYVAEEILPRLFAANRHYVNLDIVKSTLKEASFQYEDSTLKSYLHDWKQDGKLYSAGRGWYSDLPEPFVPDTLVIAPLVKTLDENFPYLEWTAWSTRQLAAFFHHLPSRHATFLMVDRDAMSTVAETLADEGYHVVSHPLGAAAKQFQLEADNTIILRPRLSSDHTERHAPPEQILVDLHHESQKLALFDTSELERVKNNLVNHYRVSVKFCERYSERRKINGFTIT